MLTRTIVPGPVSVLSSIKSGRVWVPSFFVVSGTGAVVVNVGFVRNGF